MQELLARSRLGPALVLALAAGCGGRRDSDAHPVPAREQRATVPSAPAPPPSARRVEATVVRWLGVGWANVIDVEITGQLRGRGSLWLPAGDAMEKSVLSGAAKPGSKLRLTLAPLSPPDEREGGPYRRHLRLHVDGGTEYWQVNECELAPADP